MRALRALGVLAPLLGAGCTSWTFDGSSPDVVLAGEPPAAGTLPRLNGTPATNVALMLGGDGAPYAAISEIPVTGAGAPLPQQVLRLVRLTGPATEEVVQAVQIGLTGRALFVIELSGADPMGPVVATARGPEGPEPSRRFTLPGGNKLFGFGGRDQVFFVWVQAADTRTFQVLRRDGKPGRTLPVLPGVDAARPTQKGRLFFDATGEILYTQDGDNRVVAHATGEERDVDLGVLSRAAAPDGSDAARPALLVCDRAGVRRVFADGSTPQVLDPERCDASLLRQEGASLIYASGTLGDEGAPLRQVPLSGATPPQVVVDDGAQQVLAVGPAGIVYSKDPASLFGAGVGDGWLAGRRVIERGRGVTFSGDGARLRWLEHAATSDNAGELLSAPVGGGDVLHLALNVRQYLEVSPGRLVAIANAAYRGPHNRLILLDEGARRGSWLADGARDFFPIPGTADLLARVYIGQSYDVIRVSVPRP